MSDQKSGSAAKAERKAARLAEQLRANLQKRKAQIAGAQAGRRRPEAGRHCRRQTRQMTCGRRTGGGPEISIS